MSDGKRKPLLPKKGVMKTRRQLSASPQRDNTDEESSPDELAEIPSKSITVAVFCALPYEAVAVRYCLDKEFTCHLRSIGPRRYVYSYGRIGDHNIVIARPHDMGTVKAAHCATAVSQQFPNVRLALMVGIGAGIPSPKHDIRLGDVVVSIPQDRHPGVVQYDFVKYEQDKVILKGCLNKPPLILISADGSLQEDEIMQKHPLKKILKKITNPKFKRPDTDDILFDQNFHHINKESDCSGCNASSDKKVVFREPRLDSLPFVHRGLILSGNGVVKSPQDRDLLRQDYKDAMCFEMEAAGIMDEIPCLIVRGICDYADTHKQDSWHYYAAATAAAYCRALLRKVDCQEVEEATSMKEIIKGVKELAEGVNKIQDAQRATQNIVENIDQKILLDLLHPIKEALFDSYQTEDEGECLQGTRHELLSDIATWGSSPSSPCIFWLSGMAGTGKSTISRTAAASFCRQGNLAASFFFKRGAGDQGNARQLFPTIAFQLASTVPGLAANIKRAINEEPNISAKIIKRQFVQLLLQPLRDLKQPKQEKTCFVIIIDALDECEGDRDIETILQLLPRVKEIESISLRFLLTSRPEHRTLPGFKKLQEKDRQYLILHEIPELMITRDISLFLEHRLSEIRGKHSLPEEWPGKDRVQKLITIAIPLFIFASTVCRFLEDLKWSPEKRLDEFLADPAAKSASEMDRTYLPILNQLLTGRNKVESNKLKQEFCEILGVIILLARPLSVNALTTFIGKSRTTVKRRVESFCSVLSVPDNDDIPVTTLHLSFRDFLLNTKGDFQIQETEMHWKIASHCLRVMDGGLKHNICRLPSYGTRRTEIDKHIINQQIPADL